MAVLFIGPLVAARQVMRCTRHLMTHSYVVKCAGLSGSILSVNSSFSFSLVIKFSEMLEDPSVQNCIRCCNLVRAHTKHRL